MKPMTRLEELLTEELSELYDAERQLIKALPRFADRSANFGSADAFRDHLTETRQQLARLDGVFLRIERQPGRKKCRGMEGILAEAERILKMNAEPAVRDAGLIAAAQRAEHYEISAYGCARTWAQVLGLTEVEQVLQDSLAEETAADKDLTALAQHINEQAAAVDAEVSDMNPDGRRYHPGGD